MSQSVATCHSQSAYLHKIFLKDSHNYDEGASKEIADKTVVKTWVAMRICVSEYVHMQAGEACRNLTRSAGEGNQRGKSEK